MRAEMHRIYYPRGAGDISNYPYSADGSFSVPIEARRRQFQSASLIVSQEAAGTIANVSTTASTSSSASLVSTSQQSESDNNVATPSSVPFMLPLFEVIGRTSAAKAPLANSEVRANNTSRTHSGGNSNAGVRDVGATEENFSSLTRKSRVITNNDSRSKLAGAPASCSSVHQVTEESLLVSMDIVANVLRDIITAVISGHPGAAPSTHGEVNIFDQKKVNIHVGRRDSKTGAGKSTYGSDESGLRMQLGRLNWRFYYRKEAHPRIGGIGSGGKGSTGGDSLKRALPLQPTFASEVPSMSSSSSSSSNAAVSAAVTTPSASSFSPRDGLAVVNLGLFERTATAPTIDRDDSLVLIPCTQGRTLHERGAWNLAVESHRSSEHQDEDGGVDRNGNIYRFIASKIRFEDWDSDIAKRYFDRRFQSVPFENNADVKGGEKFAPRADKKEKTQLGEERRNNRNDSDPCSLYSIGILLEISSRSNVELQPVLQRLQHCLKEVSTELWLIYMSGIILSDFDVEPFFHVDAQGTKGVFLRGDTCSESSIGRLKNTNIDDESACRRRDTSTNK